MLGARRLGLRWLREPCGGAFSTHNDDTGCDKWLWRPLCLDERWQEVLQKCLPADMKLLSQIGGKQQTSIGHSRRMYSNTLDGGHVEQTQASNRGAISLSLGQAGSPRQPARPASKIADAKQRIGDMVRVMLAHKARQQYAQMLSALDLDLALSVRPRLL